MARREMQKQESRARILASAGRGFRERGFGGLGVDGLAKEAGVTSGAFYVHFPSKSAAFHAAVETGLEQLRDGVLRLRAEHGAAWREAFVDFYLGESRRAALCEACALQSLTGDVARADDAARALYERKLEAAVDVMIEGAPAGERAQLRREAIALLALLSGGVSMARAVAEPEAAEAIVEAVRRAALAML